MTLEHCARAQYPPNAPCNPSCIPHAPCTPHATESNPPTDLGETKRAGQGQSLPVIDARAVIDTRAETDSAGCHSKYGDSASLNGCKETLGERKYAVKCSTPTDDGPAPKIHARMGQWARRIQTCQHWNFRAPANIFSSVLHQAWSQKTGCTWGPSNHQHQHSNRRTSKVW